MHSDSPQARYQGGADVHEHVSSVANDTVKLLKSLGAKKGRTETGLFLAEGARHAEEGLRHGWRPAFAFAGREALERPRTADLMARLKKAGARTLSASDKVMAALARKENPQMVVAAFHQKLDALSDFPTTGHRRFVALYEVRDPGNLGTVIRTADAAGVDGVVLVGKCCDPFSLEAVRATMGSLFAMRLAEGDFTAFDAWRRRTGANVIAASMHGTHRHDQAKWGERSIVLMGNEQSGLPADVEAACDELVRIPMSGSADSLNLASAASVMIYEAWRSGGYKGANR
jgi:TrmH family RNA methyltransferase